MNGIVAFAASAAALLALQTPARQSAWTSDATLTELAIEAQRACSAPGMPPPDIRVALIDHAGWLAGLDQRLNTPCTPRPELALRIARAVAARQALEASYGYRLLAQLYERGIAVPRDPAAARAHRRRAWLLSYHGMIEPPFADAAEMNLYVSRPETIAFARRFVGVPNMHALRVRLARGLIARGGAANRAEALSLLSSAGASDLPESRFLRARALIEGGDPALRASALRELRIAAHGSDGGEAAGYLAGMARRQLARSRAGPERREAIGWLADAAFAPGSPYRREFMLVLAAENGGLPPPTLAGPGIEAIRQRLRAPVTDDDYPAAAMRAEEVGRIALRGLIDPAGRLIFTEAVGPGQPQILLATVRRIYSRRTVPTVDLGTMRTAPYMWIELPGVVFTIRE